MTINPQDHLELRAIRNDEREALATLYQNAFRRDQATAKNWASGTSLENTLALFEAGRLAAALTIHPFEVFVGGESQQLGGIGGVATFADCQGRRYANRLMVAAMERMKEEGQALSSLYPFSFRFYCELGWDRSCKAQRFEHIRQDQIIRYQEGKLVRLINPHTDLEALSAFHNDIMSDYNLTFVRSESKWKEILDGLAGTNTFLYVIMDQGEIIGYFDCQNFAIPRSSLLSSNEYESLTKRVALRDEMSVRAMMGFLARLPAHVKNIIVQVPVDVDLHDYMTEPSPVRLIEEQQLRLIMVKEALERRGYAPEANARLSFHVTDDHCDWNKGVWAIDVDDGHAVVEKSDEEPMFGAGIGALSQIYCGYKSAAALASHGDIQVWDEAAINLCDELFLDQPTFTQDWF